jgi:tripartite-type tricarboxylate transporter receptor subunit TctC
MKALAALLLLPALIMGTPAAAQDFPNKPIKIVIPFTAGGGVDNIIRAISPALTAELGQPIVVDNKPGGGAQIAVAVLQQAPADGYTLFAAPGGPFALNPHLYKKLSYNPLEDFQGVATFMTAPMVMFTHPSGRINSIDAFRKTLKSGGEIKYSSPGQGTAPHLFGNLLAKSASNPNMLHVPYRGAPPAIQAVLSKEVDMMFDAVPTVIGLTKGGQVLPLAIAAEARHPLYPAVPTLKELGLPQITMDFWVGVVTKKGTPAPVVQRLHAAFEKVLNNPAVFKQFQERGYTRMSLSPEQFNQLIKSELEKYRPIVKESGATIE